MQIEKNEDGTIKINLKKIQIFLGIAVLIAVQFIQPLIGAVIDKNSAETTIQNHEERISKLESEYIMNHEILSEIRWNLRNHIINSGQEYIDSDIPNKIK